MDNHIRFATSMVPWIKSTMEINDSVLYIFVPRRILKVFALGGKEESIPLSNISAVSLARRFDVKKIFISVLTALIGTGVFFAAKMPVLGILLVLAGLGISITARSAAIAVEKNGTRTTLPVPFYEIARVQQFQQEVTAQIAKVEYEHSNASTNDLLRQILASQA